MHITSSQAEEQAVLNLAYAICAAARSLRHRPHGNSDPHRRGQKSAGGRLCILEATAANRCSLQAMEHYILGILESAD